MTIQAELIEVGNLEPIETQSPRGIVLRREGGLVTIIGLTEAECRVAAQWLFNQVDMTVSEVSA